MARSLVRTGLFLAVAAGCGIQAFALDEAKWSIIDNQSSKEQTLLIADFKAVVGTVHVRKAGETGDGAKLSAAKHNFPLKPNTKYEVYFDTSGKTLALTLGIGSGSEQIELNFKRGAATGMQGDRLVVSPKNYLSGSNILIGTRGFRNKAGGTFITIQDGAGAAE